MSNENEIEKKVNLEGFAASVELPEGHQLVLGELAPGTVVEVATWQGTGRPDETTNRFLLSASGPGLLKRVKREEAVEAAPEEKAITAPAETTTAPAIATPVVEFANQSVGSIAGRGEYLGLRTFGVSNSEKPELVEHPSKARAFGRGIFTFVAVIAITAMVLSFFGISAVVPTRGAKTSFGPSTAALVIYKKSAAVELGVAAVAIVENSDGEEVLFGPTNSFDATSIQIETSAGQELIPANAVAGRAFLAIPFIGTIAHIIIR